VLKYTSVLYLDKLNWSNVNVFSGRKYQEATHCHFWMWARRTYRGFMHLRGYHIKRIGEENLPTGAAIPTPNHRSIWDGLIMGWSIRGRVPGTVGKNSLFKIPILAQLLKLADVMPVPHGKKSLDGSGKTESMKLSVKERISDRIFGRGRMLVIFSEGGVFHRPEVTNLKAGAVSMAIRHNVPIVPVGIGGVEKGKRTGTIVTVIGQPIDVTDWMVDNGYTERTIDDVAERQALYAYFCEEVLVPAMQVVYDAAEVTSQTN
jgi:1-acyl-sn-glycerol-3-phosphate acyltransferase